MAKALRGLFIAFGILLGLVILAVLFFVFVFDWNHLRGWASGKASTAAGRDIAVGDIKVEWGWPVTSLHLRDLTVANVPDSKDPQMADIGAIDASFDLKALLGGTFTITDLSLDQPKIVLEKDKDGNANWKLGTSPAGAVATAPLPDKRTDVPVIGHLLIKGGSLTYRDAKSQTDLTLTANTIAGEAQKHEQIHLDGKGTYQHEPFKLDLTGGSILQLRDTDEPYQLKLELNAGPTTITVDGTVDDPLQLEGLNLAMTIKGKNAADLFPLTGVALPQTPPYDVHGRLELAEEKGKPQEWRFRAFKGRLGDSDIGGDLAYNVAGKRPKLTGAFVSNLLDFKDLGGLIGASPGNSDAATADQKAQANEKKVESPFVIPDAPLDISKLSAMDADVSFTGKRIQSGGTLLDDFYMKIVLDDRLMKVDPVRFGTAGGDVITYMTVNARQDPPQVDTDFRFSKLQLAKLIDPAAKTLGQPNVSEGVIGGVAKLKGTGKSLHEVLSHADGKIGIGMEGGKLSNLIVRLIGLNVAQALGLYLGGDVPTPVRCIVSDFNVKDGLATADAFVIDTKISNVAGNGTLNLKNEAMDLTLHPQSKDFSLVSLRSPIKIGGTFKSPDIGIDAGNLAARGGAAAALTAIFPLAAVAAFVDVGLGHDSDCTKLLGELKDDTNQHGAKNLVPVNNTVAPPKK